MVDYQHPSDLNPFQQYRQAASILRSTSRATNEGWYAVPLDLDLQVHIRLDGQQIRSRTYHAPTETWSEAPPLTEELLRDPAAVPAYAEQLLLLAKQHQAPALGIVIHIADEFATTELKPELDNPGALAELCTTVIHQPGEVLDDSSFSTEDHSWRLIPYPAAGGEAIATAVTLSRHADDFVTALRDFGHAKNFPFATLSVSAPIVALLALPKLLPGELGAPFLAVLPYPVFTVLAFFNEHGDLMLLRTLQHRGQKYPTNLRHAAATTAAALEMADPNILIMPFAGEPDPHLKSDLGAVFKTSSIQQVDWPATYPEISDSSLSPEMIIAAEIREEIDTPLANSHTFLTLRHEEWAIQDFLPMAPATADTYPSRGEMKLLRAARWTHLGLVLAVLACWAWIGMSMLEMVRRPEWTFNEDQARSVKMKLQMLQKERSRIGHWDNLLEDRSKGWTSMEMLTRFFPEESGFLLRSFQHSVSPEAVRGKKELGFVKQWQIGGFAREASLPRLTELGTREGISKAFDEVAKITGSHAYRTDLPTRSVIVNIKTLENASYKPRPPEEFIMTDESSYPFVFDLTITQRFEADDPLALSTSAAP